MEQVYAFHKTTIGHLHVMREIPCEDSSISFSAENGKYYIAIIADGHGSASCFRSAIGSKIVTEVALEHLKKFAETNIISTEVEKQFYKDLFSNQRYRQMTLKSLTDTIIAGWHDRVLEDYNDNPPSSEEMGDYAEMYKDGENIAHIYGTTLIATLMLPSCLILLHQGDGRCDVFFEDGAIEQPIPWDSRCEDNATTSLCDEDVCVSIRTQIINLEERKVIACYVGSDGVEDAYRDTYEGLGGTHILMGGVHTFYKNLTCQIADKGIEAFEEYLTEMLPEFSANGLFSRSGSGDDVSVAGIVDMETIQKFVKQFQIDIKQYDLEEQLFWKDDELRGKVRKHGILKKRFEEAENLLNEKRDAQKRLSEKILEKSKEFAILTGELELLKSSLEENRQNSKVMLSPYFDRENEEKTNSVQQLVKQFKFYWPEIQDFYGKISKKNDAQEAEYKRLEQEHSKLNNRILDLKKIYTEGEKELHALEQKFEEAKVAFEEYDVKYQAIETEKMRIKSEIDALFVAEE